MFKKTSLIVASTLAMGVLTLPAYADGHGEGDPEKGKKVFKKCMACHAVGEGAKIKVGPPLTGVLGRTAGTYEGMKYSKSLKAAGEAGLVWNAEEIDGFLTNPKKYLRKKLDTKKAKSKMSFKLKKAKDRANVIAYLSSLKAE